MGTLANNCLKKKIAAELISILYNYIPHLTIVEAFVRSRWLKILEKLFKHEAERFELWLEEELRDWLHRHGIPIPPVSTDLQAVVQRSSRDMQKLKKDQRGEWLMAYLAEQ